MTKSILTQNRLKQLLSYDKNTGNFTRIKYKQGSIAGYVGSNGYLQTTIDNNTYRLHRLAWLYEHGNMPNVIDHIDGNKLNNKMSNLRNVDVLTNNENIKKAKLNNEIGLLGVYKSGKKFRAYIKKLGEKIYLGTFSTKEQASEAYFKAKNEMHLGYIE